VPTLTAKGRCGLVVPVTHSQGGNGARSVEEPIPTLTTAKGGEFAVVMPVTHAGGPDRAQGVADPLPTVTGANRGELAVVDISCDSGETRLDLRYDILFRMLEPHELAAAMGFNTDEAAYEFAGTKTEKIKQIGNAVSVAMMQAEVAAIMADAAPKARKPEEPEFREAAE
jgi:DNA (cytosine-5)-methyltransferase 1